MSLIVRNGEIFIIKNHLNYKEKFNNFKLFIWQPERREFLGRTKKSWCKICIFYLCFYFCLSAFFIACVIIHLATVNWNKPEYEYTSNVMNQQYIDGKHIGVSPGLGFRPQINPQTSLIRVRSSASSYSHPYNYRQYVDQLDEFLKNYDLQSGELVHTFGAHNPCLDSRNYEYDKAKPCVVVKLNKLYGWVPEAYEPTDPLPIELKQFEDIVRRYPNNIFVLCEGENPVDKDLVGKIKYFSKTPNDGPGESSLGFLPFTHYPYKLIYGDDGDLTNYYQPLVFIHFPEITTYVLVNVMCKAFAKNIHVNTLYRAGSVHFELFIE